MKRFMLSAFSAIAVMFMFGVSHAANIQPVTISTYPITEAATMAAQVSGTKTIDKILFTNSSSTESVVTVYQLCGSTTTIVPVIKIVVPAADDGGNTILNFTDQVVNNPFRYTDVCFRQASEITSVYASVLHR